MIYELLLGISVMAILEGLVLALAPLRYEDLLRTLGRMSVEHRRTIGLGIVLFGVVLLSVLKSLG